MQFFGYTGFENNYKKTSPPPCVEFGIQKVPGHSTRPSIRLPGVPAPRPSRRPFRRLQGLPGLSRRPLRKLQGLLDWYFVTEAVSNFSWKQNRIPVRIFVCGLGSTIAEKSLSRNKKLVFETCSWTHASVDPGALAPGPSRTPFRRLYEGLQGLLKGLLESSRAC